METSIRFLRIEQRGLKPALCFRGRNQAHAVINDEGCIRVVSHIPVKQHDEATIVMGPAGLGQRVYPIELFVKRFEVISKRKPVTARAAYFLKRALEGGVSDDETLPPDELPGKEITVGSKNPVTYPVRSTADALLGKPVGGGGGTDARKPQSPRVAPSRAVPEPVAGASGGTLVARIAAEYKLTPQKLRKILRAAGLKAPYDDKEKQIRDALK